MSLRQICAGILVGSFMVALTPFAASVPGVGEALPDSQAQAQSAQISLTPEGYYDIQTNGWDSTYSQGLTYRYVDGELRMLMLVFKREPVYTASTLHEFRLPAPGQRQSSVTNSWDLSGTGAFLQDFHGIWYEQDKDRLWITTATDYTVTNYPARVTLLDLGDNGSVSVQKQFFLDVPAKRVQGGCQKTPAALVSTLGGPYVCGWGGYTSILMGGGGVSLGPTMYAIPDPDSIANGSTVQTRVVMDHFSGQQYRGVRKTLPLNYFDGGDDRPNGTGPSSNQSRPVKPPLNTADWQSPNEDGLGWLVWGDVYRQTGFFVGNTFALIPSLCGEQGATSTTVGSTVMDGYVGACWYGASAVKAEGRLYELHTWDATKLGSDIHRRPDNMEILNLPRGEGNSADPEVHASFNPSTNMLYVAAPGGGASNHDVRIHAFSVNGGGSGTVPTPTPTPTAVPTPTPTPTPTATPTPPAANVPPAGNFDEITSSGTARGWAYDPNSPSSSVQVHFYLNGAAGQGGTLIGSATANGTRSDVNSALGISGGHGFSWSVPQQYRNGQQGNIRAYAIDRADSAMATLLPGSPKSFVLGTAPTPTPAVTPTPTPTPTPAQSSSCSSTVPTNSYLVCYYDNDNFTGNTVSRTEQSVNMDLPKDAIPVSGIQATSFSARWEGNFQFESGTYDFTTVADDGIRLYIDNQLVFEDWSNHAARTNTVSRSVTGGTHAVRVEYYQATWQAVAKLSWTKTGSEPEPTPTPTPTPTPAATPTPTPTPTSGSDSNPTPTPTPTPGSSRWKPTGWLDGITSSGTATGWAFDRDLPESAVPVHFYLDGPAGRGGKLIGAVDTSTTRTDVNSYLRVSGAYGYAFGIPTEYRDGQRHSLYAYAVDPVNATSAVQLMGSPKSFSLSGAAPTPTPTASPTPTVTPTPTPTPEPTPTPATDVPKDATLIKDRNSSTVYVMEYGKKRAFSSWQVFIGLGYSPFRVRTMDVSGIPDGAPLTTSDQRHVRGSVVLDRSTGTVFFLGADQRYPYPTSERFLRWGWIFSDIVVANEHDLALPIGSVVSEPGE